MKKVLSLFLVVTMLISIAACGKKGSASADASTSNTSNATGEKTIKIGVFQPQTGENGGGGLQEVFGTRFAHYLYPTVNVGGEEYKVELFEVDNKSDKTEAVNAAQKLIQEKVVAVIGSYGSGVSIAAGEYFADAKIPAMGCSCTNPQVTNGNEYYFRVCFLDPFQGTVMASYCKKHGYDKVAVLTQLGDDYSEGLGNFFIKACEKAGIEVVATEKFQTNEQDFKAVLTNIKGKNPQFLFAPSSITSAPLILSQARELGLDCQFGGGDTWENGTIIDNAQGAAEGMVVTSFYEANPETAQGEEAQFLKGNVNVNGQNIHGFSEYLTKIENQPATIPAMSALAYDAYLAIIKAIEAAGSLKGEDIKNALVNQKFNGVTGEISYDENGDANKTCAYVKEVADGKFVYREIVDISSLG